MRYADENGLEVLKFSMPVGDLEVGPPHEADSPEPIKVGSSHEAAEIFADLIDRLQARRGLSFDEAVTFAMETSPTAVDAMARAPDAIRRCHD